MYCPTALATRDHIVVILMNGGVFALVLYSTYPQDTGMILTSLVLIRGDTTRVVEKMKLCGDLRQDERILILITKHSVIGHQVTK